MVKYSFFLLLLVMLTGCSTHPNTPVRRSWYGLNSRYNTYYNAHQSFRDGIQSLKKKQDTIQASIHFEESIQKCRKAIKLYSIREKPRKKRGWQQHPRQRALQNQTEYNPFIVHCWLLMGKSLYYKQNYRESLQVFSYILHHFPENRKINAEAKQWIANIQNLQPITPENNLPFISDEMVVSNFQFLSGADSIHHLILEAYQQKEFITVRKNCTYFHTTYPDHPLKTSLLYIEALTYASEGNRENLATILKELTESTSADTTIQEISHYMLEKLEAGQELSGEYIPLPFFVTLPSVYSSLPDTPSLFRSLDETLPDEIFYLLIYSPAEAFTDKELLFRISSFNFTELLQIQLDTEIRWLGNSRIVIIREFKNTKEIELYQQMIHNNVSVFGLELHSRLIPVSAYNYNLIHTEKDLETYMKKSSVQ